MNKKELSFLIKIKFLLIISLILEVLEALFLIIESRDH